MATKARCAYCGKPGKSREHIFPTWLIKKTPHYEARFSKKDRKIGQNEHVIKDVCTTCNSGPLSQVDDYCHILYDEYFSKPVEGPIEFEYDFRKLTRWLLKVSFNSARKQKARVSSFKPLIPYMLGDSPTPPDNVIFFVEIIKPYVGMYRGKNVTFKPEDHRIGPLHFAERPAFVFVKEGRQVAIEGYYFYIIFLQTPFSTEIYEKLKQEFRVMERLTPDLSSITLLPYRNYLQLKHPEYMLNKNIYYEWRDRYLGRGGEEFA
jgi:hypothetical protein